MTQDQHDHIEHSRQFDNVPKDCPECEGTGKVSLSDCCGALRDFDETLDETFCMACLKECECELDTCDDCDGTGEVQYQD